MCSNDLMICLSYKYTFFNHTIKPTKCNNRNKNLLGLDGIFDNLKIKLKMFTIVKRSSLNLSDAEFRFICLWRDERHFRFTRARVPFPDFAKDSLHRHQVNRKGFHFHIKTINVRRVFPGRSWGRGAKHTICFKTTKNFLKGGGGGGTRAPSCPPLPWKYEYY